VLEEDDGHNSNSNMNMDVSHYATISKPDQFQEVVQGNNRYSMTTVELRFVL